MSNSLIINRNLADAIERHRKALAEMNALVPAQGKAEAAHIAAKRTDPQLAAAFKAADAALMESCSRQSEAHEAVLSAPVLTLADMQAKAAHLSGTARYTIHDESTMRTLLASVARTTDEDDQLFPAAVRRSALSGMSLEDLNDLHGAATTLFDVAAGLANQPRFRRDQRSGATKAMQGLNDLLANCIGEVIDEARGRSPEAEEDRERRSWLLLRHEAESRDALGDIAAEIAFLQGRA